MNQQHDSKRIEALAYQIWEEQGRPEGRHEENWAEAERRLNAEPHVISKNLSRTDGLVGDRGPTGQAQDPPGRPKSPSSRQQTQPGQAAQMGSAKLDGKGASSPAPRR